MNNDEPMGLGDLIHKMLTEYEKPGTHYDEETRKIPYLQSCAYTDAFEELNAIALNKPKKQDE